METTERIQKYEINNFKEEIKKLAANQKVLRNQRKTVKLVGERTMEPAEATWRHQMNGEKLRAMYAAYGLMRDKPFSVTENRYAEEDHPLNKYKNTIDQMLEKYTIKVKELAV